MPATIATAAAGQLCAGVKATHDHIGAALAAPTDRFDVVVWTSAHLAAMNRALHPLLRAHLPADAYDRLVAADAALQQRLRLLERALSGDASIGATTPLAATMVTSALRAYVAAETLALTTVDAVTPPDAALLATQAYNAAIRRGPTRPHPHLPRTGLFAGPAFAAARFRDRVLDVLDSRHIPLPRDEVEPRLTPGVPASRR